jgi:hypothetical protein
MVKLNSRGIEMSFTWIFAIIVGISVFIFAFILISKIIDTGSMQSDAKVAKEVGVLLNPLETGFEEGKTSSFSIPTKSRIINKCYTEGNFGRQVINVRQFSFGKWSTTDVDVGFLNKYIFSNGTTEGKKFYVFAKPFDFPFKISDLIYLTSSNDEYCFVSAPEDIENELYNLNQANFFTEDCREDEDKIQVCFGGSGCDVNVLYDEGSGSVRKEHEETVYFETDALMYAAIFSNSETYECQVKRLMQRVDSLSQIYMGKIGFSASRGCNSNLNNDLVALRSLANGLGSSSGLNQIKTLSDDISEINNYAICSLW